MGAWCSARLLRDLGTKWCKDEKAQLQINKMYSVYSYRTAYIACWFGGDFFILGDVSEGPEDAKQLLFSPLCTSKLRYQSKEHCLWYQSCIHDAVQWFFFFFFNLKDFHSKILWISHKTNLMSCWAYSPARKYISEKIRQCNWQV